MGILTAGFATGQLSFLPTAAWLASHYGWRVAVLPAVIRLLISPILYPLFGRDWPCRHRSAAVWRNARSDPLRRPPAT